MRKLLTIVLAFAAIGAHAQFAQPVVAVGNKIALSGVDTVFAKIPVTQGTPSLGIGGNLTKTAGTLTGKAYLLRSMDNGVTYQMYDSAVYVAPTLNSTTTATTATSSFQFEKSAPSGSVYEVEVVSGTAGAAVGVVVWRRLPNYTHF